jgi:hypothetical protein
MAYKQFQNPSTWSILDQGRLILLEIKLSLNMTRILRITDLDLNLDSGI